MDNNITTTLKSIHDELIAQFAANEDTLLAKELEEFLNAIIYNAKWSEGSVQGLSGVLTNDLLKSIKESEDFNSFRKLFTESGKTTKTIGQRGEKAFSTYIYKIIESELKKIEGKLSEEIKKSFSPDAMQVGKKTTAIKVPLNIIGEKIKKGFKSYDDKYFRTYLRQGKNDLKVLDMTFEGKIKGNVTKLLGLTASIKNYKSFTVKLEQVNHEKAYLAIIPNLKQVDEKKARELYEGYYGSNPTLRADKEVTEHINHISKIYALTGYG
jgi:hypothetical protein